MKRPLTVSRQSSDTKPAAAGAWIMTLLLLSPASVKAEPSTVAPVQQASAPVYRVGETYTLSYDGKDGRPAHVISLTVVSVSSAGTRLSGTRHDGTSFEVDYDAMGCVTRNSRAHYEPSLGSLQFPMSVGMSWQANYRIVSDKPLKEVSARVSVEGTEIVHVPAGDFFAFRLQSRGVIAAMVRSKLADQKSYESTYWYAPSVGRIVKSETHAYSIAARHAAQSTQSFELVGYTPAPGHPQAAASSPASGN